MLTVILLFAVPVLNVDFCVVCKILSGHQAQAVGMLLGNRQSISCMQTCREDDEFMTYLISGYGEPLQEQFQLLSELIRQDTECVLQV